MHHQIKNMIILYIISMVTPLLGLYVDQRLGVEDDVNGKQEEKFDDSLISSHNFRKQRGNSFSGWRRFNDDDSKHPVFQDSYKNLFSKLRRDSKQKSTAQEYKWNTTNDNIIDVKFRQLRPSRRSGGGETNDFAYHDKMISGEFGDVQDFERNLQTLIHKEKRRKLDDAVNYLHGGEVKKPYRRSGLKDINDKPMDPEKEVLFHHAVPIDMKIYGYLQLPLEQ